MRAPLRASAGIETWHSIGNTAPRQAAAMPIGTSVHRYETCTTRANRIGPTRKPSRFAPNTAATRMRRKLCGSVTLLQTRLVASDPKPIPARKAPSIKAKLLAKPAVVNENRRYQTISYPSETNPATPEAMRAVMKSMPKSMLEAALGPHESGVADLSEISPSKARCDRRPRNCHISTVAPTTALKPAANATVPDCPSHRIRNSPAQKHATADPRVFAA